MANLARQMINRARREFGLGSAEAAVGPLTQSKRRGIAERDANDVLEHRPVLVPADAAAGIVADQQGLDELIGREAGEGCGPRLHRLKPSRQRVGRREPAVLEIVASSE